MRHPCQRDGRDDVPTYPMSDGWCRLGWSRGRALVDRGDTHTGVRIWWSISCSSRALFHPPPGTGNLITMTLGYSACSIYGRKCRFG